jgi:hypothetical protein
MRDVGAMGEAILRQWAAEAGLICNPVERDAAGWDFLIEFPPPQGPVPLDKAPRPLQAFVQVKSSDRRGQVFRVKLDNWLRMVRTPLPAFFLLLEFDGKATPGRAFIQHVWQEEIRAVLKMLRELGAGVAGLNKKSLSVTSARAEPLDEAGAVSFAETIQRMVGDPDAYQTRKQKTVDTTGYEEFSGEASLKIQVPEAYRSKGFLDLWIDLSLGLIPELTVAGAEMWDVRFGIRAPEPTHTFTSGVLKAGNRKPVVEGMLEIANHDGSQAIRMAARGYAPAGLPRPTPLDRLKFLIEAEGLTLVITPGSHQGEFKLNIPGAGKPKLLRELVPAADLISFLARNTEKGEALARITLDTKPLGTVMLGGVSVSQHHRQWAELVRKAWAVVKVFDLHEGAYVSSDYLLGQKPSIELMDAAFRGETLDARISFGAAELSLPVTCLPSVLHVRLEDTFLLTACAFFGQALRTGAREDALFEYEMAVERISVVSTRVISEVTDFNSISRAMLLEMASQFEDDYNVITWWDDPGIANGEAV